MPKLHEGTLHSIENDQIEFANDLFLRGQPDLISQIKRKDTKKSISAAQAKVKINLVKNHQVNLNPRLNLQ